MIATESARYALFDISHVGAPDPRWVERERLVLHWDTVVEASRLCPCENCSALGVPDYVPRQGQPFVCLRCRMQCGGCDKCKQQLVLVGSWTADRKLQFYQSDSSGAIWCPACRPDDSALFECPLGQIPTNVCHLCPQCKLFYKTSDAVHDEHYRTPLCSRCVQTCALCLHPTLLCRDMGARDTETLRVRCVLCQTPKCAKCGTEVGLRGELCYEQSIDSLVCAPCYLR